MKDDYNRNLKNYLNELKCFESLKLKINKDKTELIVFKPNTFDRNIPKKHFSENLSSKNLQSDYWVFGSMQI